MRTAAKIALASALIILAVVGAVAYLTPFVSFPWERSTLISSDIEIHFGFPVQACGWSPDDCKILYGYEGKLWTMNPDGSSQIVLLSLQSEEIPGTYGVQYAPDGKRLLFWSQVGMPGNLSGSDWWRYTGNIYVVNVDGSNLVRLTSDNVSYEPSWSPDGQSIVFVKATAKDETELWIMNADGTQPRQLTNLPGTELSPIWSPDGKRIAFVNQWRTVYIMNSDGSGVSAVPLDSTSVFGSGWSWSPDSSIIVSSNGEDIWAFTIDGRVIRRLIATMEEDWNPRVSHDGRRIVYETFQPGSWGAMNLHVATLNKPLSCENLGEYSHVPAMGRVKEDVLVGYKIQLDRVEVTFNVSYANYGWRGNLADPGQKFIWITYTQLNKGTEPVLAPLGNKYGVKVQFDLIPEQDLEVGKGLMLPPGDPLEGGVVLAIRVDVKATQLVVYSLETGIIYEELKL